MRQSCRLPGRRRRPNRGCRGLDEARGAEIRATVIPRTRSEGHLSGCSGPRGVSSESGQSRFTVPVVRRQHRQRRYQDPLRLLDAYRPSAPALPHRPLADRALKTDDVPDATASGTAEAAERLERCADTTAGVNLRVGEITTAIAATEQSHHRHATDDVEAGDGELRLEVPRASCMSLVIVPARSIRPRLSTKR
jgi:hypothetical protein